MRWLERSTNDRMISGLGGGIAAHLGIGSAYVRAGFITLAFAGLIGVFLYATLWLVAPVPGGSRSREREATLAQKVGMALMFAGVLLVLRSIGLWFGAASWAVTAASFGSAALWDQRPPGGATNVDSRLEWWKRAAGIVLVGVGLGFVFGSIDSLSQIGPVILGATAAVVGAAIIFGPRISQLGAQLSAERRERIASEERSKIAADLHDSVLQSLAMIQRSDDAPTMVTIARAQERELRSWLYGKKSDTAGTSLQEALQAVADRIEHDHNVPIDVVVVKDIPSNERLDPLIKAAGEAMLNAARHSGAPRVSVYAEAGTGEIEVFVSDTGTGFAVADIDSDRHGVRQSLIGRMERHGGVAEITSEPGEGTEVRLAMPIEVVS